MRSVSITISGKVQGVWFRKFTCDKAKELGITGTVQNLANGNVLIHATATSGQIRVLEKWCWLGSPLSEVKSVTVAELDSLSVEGFRIVG